MVVLFEDETILRLFPVLRRSWSYEGEQAPVLISGRNAQRVLFCALNPKSGRRLVMVRKGMWQENFQDFLKLLHQHYHSPVYLILDKAGLHTAKESQRLARDLHVELVWLPKQCPELNCVDQLFKCLKQDVSANHQYKTIVEHARAAEKYLYNLTKEQVLTKAGVLSKNFWLKNKM
ncbi:MAG TPA: transposase [Flavisolibacter sp.]|nr:transposase [Flavisolibacter sp.]